MKTVKAICAASILALAISVPVSAGDIAGPGSPVPGGVHTPGMAAPAPGEIDSPGFADILWTLIAML